MKTRTVIIYHGNSYIGEYTRDRRLPNGEWVAGTAPTKLLRALVRSVDGSRAPYRVQIGDYVLVINYKEKAQS